jgi:hypothetical protein
VHEAAAIFKSWGSINLGRNDTDGLRRESIRADAGFRYNW